MGTRVCLCFLFLIHCWCKHCCSNSFAKSYLESGAKKFHTGLCFLASGSGALIAGLTSSFSMNIYLTIFIYILTASLLQVISAVSSVSVGISQPSHSCIPKYSFHQGSCLYSYLKYV